MVFLTSFVLSMPVDPEVMTFEVASESSSDVVLDDIEVEIETTDNLPEKLPFPTYSRGALKQYALKNVSLGRLIYNTTSGGYDHRYFVQNTPQQIVDDILNHDIEIVTTRPEFEKVNVTVYLQDSGGRTLFSASAYNKGLYQEEGLDKWLLEKINLELVMQENIPIDIPDELGDIDNVNIVSRDQNGYVKRHYSSWVYNEQFGFPAHMAGEFGEISFIHSDGREFIYDLQGGFRLGKEDFEIEYNLEIENYRELRLTGGTQSDQWVSKLYRSDGGRSSAPIYYLTVESRTIFEVTSYIREIKKGGDTIYNISSAWLEKVGDSFETEVLPDSDNVIEVDLDPGKYYLRLEFDVLEEPGYNLPPGKG